MAYLKNTRNTYGIITRLLHWSMAIIIIGLLALGLYMEGLPRSEEKFELYGLHKSFGVLVLGLFVLRYLWRLSNTVPQLPNHLSSLEKLAAHLGHYALYGMMLLMPVSGILMSGYGGYPISFFGLFELPKLVSPNKELGGLFNQVHMYLGWAMIGLVSAHIGAAFWHLLYHKDRVMQRMVRGK